ncbi:hypothetical protein EDC01DRAFT_645987 [Geopyxis carbonaria]|nr:hypothetical protein EDC01DRAFT_645987 [Geopyxis carbonaria]
MAPRKPSASAGTARPKTLTENAAVTKPRANDPSRPAARKGSKSAAHRKSTTHNSVGVYKTKAALRGDTRTPRQRAAALKRLETTLPVLNTIVPAAASVKRKGGNGKIGKVFVEDHDMVRLMRMVETVSGKKEGEAESKLEKARRLETIRELRRKEEEAKIDIKGKKVAEAKELAKQRRGKGKSAEGGEEQQRDRKPKKAGGKKKVSFA